MADVQPRSRFRRIKDFTRSTAGRVDSGPGRSPAAGVTSRSRDVPNLSGSGQRSAKVTRRYSDLSAKDRGQMALVGEADFLGDHSQRTIGSAHQSFCPFDPPLHHVTLRSHTNRLLEAAAEVVGTETCHPGEIGQGQPTIEIGIDIL